MMAGGRSSASTSQWGGGADPAHKTRRRVSVSATRTTTTTTTVSRNGSNQHEHYGSDGGHSMLLGGSMSAHSKARMDGFEGDDEGGSNSMYRDNNKEEEYEAGCDDDDDDDDDGWEDLWYEPVFRDAKFPEGDGDDGTDSEYAPSEHGDSSVQQVQLSDSEVSPSELEDEEEETSVAGLFANVVRQFGSRKNRKHDKTNRHEDEDALDPDAFSEHDARYWGNAAEKQQWVERYNAANKQFVHRYGCRIDSPAHPDAKARLRREKKKKSAYTLILFALAAAYLVQLVVLSTSVPSASLSLTHLHSVSEKVTRFVKELPPSSEMYQMVLDKLSGVEKGPPLSTISDEAPAQSATEPVELKRQVEVGEEVEVRVAEPLVDSPAALDDPIGSNEEVAIEVDGQVEATAERTSVAPDASDEQPEERLKDEEADKLPLRETAGQSDDRALHHEETTTASTPESDSRELAEQESDSVSEYSKVAVQLCSKLLYRLVKSKHDRTVQEAATRACDAAVSMASQESVEWMEARVLRGDLWSLVSEFGAADDDYNAATTSPVLREQQGKQTALAQDIQLKILSNRWIHMFTKKQYKELYRECDQVAATTDHIAASLRSLASDWVLVFKKKQRALDVLTKSRAWTLQRLEYA